MSINLLDIAKSTLAPVLISKAESLFGMNDSLAGKAIAAILPTLLSGVLSKASTASGAHSLFNAINDHSIDANVGQNFANMLSTPASVSSLGEQGGKLLGMLFGDKASGLGEQVANIAELPGQAKGVGGLLALAAPAIFGLLKNQIVGGKLSQQGFSSLLASQAPILEKSLPAKIAEWLGWGSLASFFGGIGNKLTSGTAEVAKQVVTSGSPTPNNNKSGGFWKWLLPLLAIGLGAFLIKSCGKSDDMPKPPPPPPAPVAAAPAPAPAAPAPAEKFDPVAAATDAKGKYEVALKALEGGKCDADALSKALGLYVINFASASAAIPSADIGELKKAVPALKACTSTGVKIEVAGHTDNQGNPAANQKLSEARANAVKTLFAGSGIPAAAMQTKGFGDTQPVGDNKTDAGRFQNRRITYNSAK